MSSKSNNLKRDLENVVIKLGLLKQGDDPIFRLVPFELLKVTELGGTSGVNNLKKFAIALFEGTSDAEQFNIDDYKIALKYDDIDGDKVVIFTDSDVVSAMKEYSSVGKVKVLADVSYNSSSSSSRASASTQTFVFNVEKATQATQESPSQSDAKTSFESPSSSEAHSETPPASGHTFHTFSSGTSPELTSSIAGILRFAASVAGNATSAHASAAVNEAMKHVTKAADAVEEHAKKVSAAAKEHTDSSAQRSCRQGGRASRQAARFARKSARATRRFGGLSPDEEVIDVETKSVATEATDGKVPVAKEDVELKASKSVQGGEGTIEKDSLHEERLFIHGWHTCDSCLTTPIIGKRFHAVNIPDFDLCERCHTNHQGDHLKFVEEKLERDLPFQDRWHDERELKHTKSSSSSDSSKYCHFTDSGFQEAYCKYIKLESSKDLKAATFESGTGKVGSESGKDDKDAKSNLTATRETTDGKIAIPTKAVELQATNSVPVNESTIKKESVSAERLFIHGRHTCDSCLTTPIIGKRFHAANRSDYDLCERCYTNYQGDNLKFVEETLERDIPFQDRWHNRRARLSGSRRFGGMSSKFKQNAPVPVPPPAPQHPLSQPPCARSSISSDAPQMFSDKNVSPDKFEFTDHALKEAIRRSLEDQRSKKDTTMSVDPVVTIGESMKVDTGSVKDVDGSNASNRPTIDVNEVVNPIGMSICNSEEKSLYSTKSNAGVSDFVTVETVSESDLGEMTANTDPVIACVTNTVESEIEPEIQVAPYLEPEEEAETEVHFENVENKESVIPDAFDMVDMHEKSGNNENARVNEGVFSFVSEDEGTTAAILGATLDRMAKAIDSLNWDLEQPGVDSPRMSPDSDSDEEDDELCDGTKIVDGDEESVLDDDSNGTDGWDFVAEEDQMARAAHALGSALFNSDLERSNEVSRGLSESQGTSLSSATGLSTLATVPSTVRSIGPDSKVSPVQLIRWHSQLEQLHELGFTNDEKSIDILESLCAANIGVDSNEEVSVEQVVNSLLKF